MSTLWITKVEKAKVIEYRWSKRLDFLIPFHLKFHLSYKPTSYCECTGGVESIDIRFVLSEFDLVPND